MKKFAFPLEKVFEYRRQLELQRRRALAKAMEVLGRRESELKSLASKMISYRNSLAERGVGKISARELALYRSYLTHVERQVERACQWLGEARNAVENHRADLVKASKETKVLEKVKARQRARYEYETDREETKQLDEIGTAKFLAGKAAVGEEAV